ncbi:MAG: DegT/DnrJ/EryC1/StrS family aminotransferase [Cyanobacteria bacterium]|nr:DegT/DnrJ/EryC1/StrS family aminotransferase [Cyanobacteriota bacterium]
MTTKYRFSLQYPKPLEADELGAMNQLARDGNFSRYTSDVTNQLEQEFSKFFGVAHSVTCSSGTAAIHGALIGLDLPVGSEVITTPVTDVGVVLPIIYQNLIPVFADLDPTTYNLDPKSVEAKITPNTSAIIAVHLAGNPAPLDELLALAKRHNIPLIEDCSQAHGAEYHGKRVGSMGTLGIASLQQSKHITSGEGGVIMGNDTILMDRVRLAVDKGWQRFKSLRERRYEFLSLNYRYTGIQAAAVLPQVRRVDRILAKKRRMAALLRERLQPLSDSIGCQLVLDGAISSYYSFPTYVKRDEAFRDELVDILARDYDIECAYGYANPVPLYLCTAALEDPVKHGRGLRYTERRYPKGTCPVAEDLLKRSFLLPFNEKFDESDVKEMVTRVGAALERMVTTHAG